MKAIRKNEIHPLENPLILDQIFEGMCLDDLKSCRSVCRTWCRAISPIIQKMVSDVVVADFYEKYENTDKTPWEFLMLMEKENEDEIEPCTIFKITADLTFEKVPTIFWKICGSSIKRMHINFDKEFTRDSLQKAILQYCTSLETLTITKLDGKHVQEPSVCLSPPNHKLKKLNISDSAITKVSWWDILSHFPAIEEFTADNRVKYLEGFFYSLELARNNNPSNWQIKHLSFNCESITSPERVIQILEQLNLPLETLDIGSIGRMEDWMKRFLTVQSATLKKLMLSGDYDSHNPEEGILMEALELQADVIFQNLTELILNNIDLHSISFLDSFPKLEKFELTGKVRISSDFPRQLCNIKTISRCRELSINVEDCDAKSLRQIFTKLSNVQTLRIKKCDNTKFTVICELLTKLLRLHLIRDLVDDIGISGLTEEQVQRVNEGLCWPCPMSFKPNLSHLKKLQVLEWDIYNEGQVPGYTTAIYVQQLPNLQRFCILSYFAEQRIRIPNNTNGFAKKVCKIWDDLLALGEEQEPASLWSDGLWA